MARKRDECLASRDSMFDCEDQLKVMSQMMMKKDGREREENEAILQEKWKERDQSQLVVGGLGLDTAWWSDYGKKLSSTLYELLHPLVFLHFICFLLKSSFPPLQLLPHSSSIFYNSFITYNWLLPWILNKLLFKCHVIYYKSIYFHQPI